MSDIPPSIQTLLDLFATALADVRFADVDAETLGRVASDVHSAAEVVAAAQSALDAARATLQERQETLLTHASRALAYARVYAETDDALSAQLDAIALPRPARRARDGAPLVLSVDPQPAPRRGRPRKAAPSEPVMEDAPLLAAES